MLVCHVCSASCEDTAELCPVCGAELQRETEKNKESEPEILIENPVLAACPQDVVTAEIYKDVLKEYGIPFICEEGSGSMKVLFGGGFVAESIYVDESNLEGAQNLYQEVLNSESAFEEDFEV